MGYQDIQVERFGTDGVLPGVGETVEATASGDWPTIAGRPNLLAAHIRRAGTSPGQMIHRPLYGGGLLDGVEQIANPSTQARQDVRIRQNALRDLRISEATATSTVDTTGRAIVTLTIQPRGEKTTETATLVQE